MARLEKVRLFGFGSYFKHIYYRDIDLLIIHSTLNNPSIRLAILVKNKILNRIPEADITMLSVQENNKLRFIEKSRAIFICDIREDNIDNDLDLVEKYFR